MKKKTINKVMILVVAGIAVFLSALTVASMTMEKPKTASQVETVEVEKGNVAEELDATGTVESRNKKVFFSPVNATVKKLNFEAGDSVRKGQQLVTYDLEDLEKENQKALLNVKSGRLDLEDAVNQSEEALEKQSEAKANVQTLEGPGGRVAAVCLRPAGRHPAKDDGRAEPGGGPGQRQRSGGGRSGSESLSAAAERISGI